MKRAVTQDGTAEASRLLIQQVEMPNGQRAWAFLTLAVDPTLAGSVVHGYAVPTTKFYERGPNDETYQLVPAEDGFMAFSNWAGNGICPSTFTYDVYQSGDTVFNVLSSVKYFMNGE